MTRGIIVFIDKNGHFYYSTEFNGDMHSDVRGVEIIEKYREGKLASKSDFEKFVESFDRKYYRYGEEGSTLIRQGRYDEYKLNLMLMPDYFYVINHSGERIIFTCKSNTFEIENQTMTITYFEKLDQVVKMDEIKHKVLISRNKFVEIIEKLKLAHDFTDKVDDLIRDYRERLDVEFMDGAGLSISHARLVVELLETMLNDKGKMIDYFIYEMDYGRKFKLGDVIDEDGNEINIGTAEDLYDYLIDEI